MSCYTMAVSIIKYKALRFIARTYCGFSFSRNHLKKVKNYYQGFTIIELLFVVALIGILASIVLVSLHDAHVKRSEASAMTSFSHARAGAELVFTNNVSNYDPDLSK